MCPYMPIYVMGNCNSRHDLMTRDHQAQSTPKVDLYVAGFPCQTFSQAGLQQGFLDKRGIVFYGCADYIDCKRPRAFILENVKGFLSHDGGKTFRRVMTTLRGIGDGAYEVKVEILDAQDHGVPQSRPRVYIVGIRRDVKANEFVFPAPLPRVSLEGPKEQERPNSLEFEITYNANNATHTNM